jgi:hypothetical protein
MERPRFEIADIIRRADARFTSRYREFLSWAQVKVLNAILRCRTAALGGHRINALAADIRRSPTTPAVWGVLPNGEWRVRRACCNMAARRFDSPLRFGLQKSQQLIGSPKLALAKIRRHDRFDGLQFLGGISPNINFRGGQTAVPQP